MLNNNKFYQNDISLTKELNDLCKLSKDINGFKTGRTVIPKLLNIYYPSVFLPIFNDQDHFLSNLFISEVETESTGLDLYLEYNYKILKIKEKIEEILARKFDNYEFTRLLYFCFPKEETPYQPPPYPESEQEEPSFEALEVQHYQRLLHRNFNGLFPNLKYFDEEEQKPKNGQYDTQTIGIIDMLCQDERGNFIVIEIKRQATDRTIGQILRYIGWVKEELCKEGQNASGIIVAERKDIQLEFALKAIPNVKFYKLVLNIKVEEQ